MVQGDGELNQPLQKLLLRAGGGPPDVLENLMRLEELGMVEELDSVSEGVGGHVPF
jgi:hypothetical protein